ncbi:MAG TPA: hypothetical protein DCQ04_04995 [Actinobacteria bacterium]|jgi:hypothetical protein|nr:hypothetical protein [Actinomycetota bacterium]
MSVEPSDVVRGLHAALEAGTHGDELRGFFTEDAVTVERPNRLKPAGDAATIDQMITASTAGVGLLSWQRYEVRSLVEVGSEVIVRCTWTGQVAKDIGPFHKDQLLTAHLAQFIGVRGDKVASIETYDCYEPF